MRVRLMVLACAASACSTDVVPVPAECEVTVLEESITAGFEWRMRLLVLLDRRSELPGDVVERIASVEETLLTGDLDGDGTMDFRVPFSVEAIVVDTVFDASLADLVAPHVPQGFVGSRTELFVVFVTTGDLPESYAGEVRSVLGLHSSPGRVGAVAVGGVPMDALASRPLDYAAVLADPRMAPDAGPVCVVEGIEASPAAVATALVHAFDQEGAITDLVSICDDAWDRALLGRLVAKVASASSGGGCLPRPLSRLEDGRVPCTVVETVHADDPQGCDHLPGRVASAENPGRSCVLDQVSGPDEGSGWYYDDFTMDVHDRCGSDGRRLSFTEGFYVEGATYTLHCVTETGDCAP